MSTMLGDGAGQTLKFDGAVDRCLPAETKRRLRRLAGWDLSKVRKRVRSRMGWTTRHAKAVEQEYRKFFALIAIHPNKPYGMAGEVDEFWHEHVVHTLDYERMCFDTVGCFVHHTPEDEASDTASDDYCRNTLTDLTAHFGKSRSRIWPSAENVRCKNCKSCGKGSCRRVTRADAGCN